MASRTDLMRAPPGYGLHAGGAQRSPAQRGEAFELVEVGDAFSSVTESL